MINLNLASMQPGQMQQIPLNQEALSTDDSEYLEIMPLGAGCEVGRSCLYMQCKGRKIMLDCGLHPAREGIQALPYFDMINPEEIDLLLLTHFHVDHCAGLPYFTERTGFKGNVYMTHPTKFIYKYIAHDFVRVANISTDEQLFDEKDVERSSEKIKMIDYHQEVEEKGIKFTAYRAGHVLGAAMFLIEIDGVKILYTGDYSCEEDRHLKPAEIPTGCEVDVLIVESTYGVEKHENREVRETKFKQLVHEVVRRGGKCLMPCFALGRAQELLLILNEYWRENPELESVPIIYSGSLAQRSLEVFKTHRNMMSDELRMELEKGQDPFKFEQRDQAEIESETGPLVVMAGPGMLQSGLSRELFLKWAPDKNNGIIFTGYSVEGTLAKQVMNSSKLIPIGDQTLRCEMSVETISFSAHADFIHTRDYIEQVLPPNIILVHGDQQQMRRLKGELNQIYHEKIQIINPRNCQLVRLKLVSKKNAQILGHLAQDVIKESISIREKMANQIERPLVPTEDVVMEQEDLSNYAEVEVSGIFIKHDFDHIILNEDEVEKYTNGKLTHSLMKQTLFVDYQYDIQVLLYFMHAHFPSVQTKMGQDEVDAAMKKSDNKYDLKLIIGRDDPNNKNYGVTIKYYYSAQKLKIQWISSPRNDMLADSISLLILNINDQASPTLVQMLEITKAGRKEQEFQLRLQMTMQNHFEITQDLPDGRIKIMQDEENYLVLNIQSRQIEQMNGEVTQIKETVQEIIRRAEETMVPAGVAKCVH